MDMNNKVEKRSKLWWIMQIIPPLFILPLSTLPMDINTGIFWLAGIIASFISIFSIGRKILARFRNKDDKSSFIDLIRPGLTMIFMILAILSTKYSVSKAENDVFEIAKFVQTICDSENHCPECIPKWDRTDSPFQCEASFGGLVKYRALYGVNEDKKEFSIMLRLNIDRNIYFYGGVGKEVQRDYKKR